MEELTLVCSKLALYLQYHVDDKAGKAQWIADQQKLVVTLPIMRPEDFYHPSIDPSPAAKQ